MISIIGAKEWPEKIKQVTSVYVQYKKLSNSSFNRCFNMFKSWNSYNYLLLVQCCKWFKFRKHSSKHICWLVSLRNYDMTKNHSFCSSILIRSVLNLPVFFIHVLMLNFKNRESVSLILLNCVDVANISAFFRKGEMKCFQ